MWKIWYQTSRIYLLSRLATYPPLPPHPRSTPPTQVVFITIKAAILMLFDFEEVVFYVVIICE